LLFGFGMIAIFGSSEIELSGAGPLGCLTTATVAGQSKKDNPEKLAT
jgi:hypothetical protein